MGGGSLGQANALLTFDIDIAFGVLAWSLEILSLTYLLTGYLRLLVRVR
jgi:hypothetical protein